MEKRELEVLEIGNMPVILSGIAAAVLAIIGLAGIIPEIAVAASAIAIGASLVLVGIALGVERRHILAETVSNHVGPRLFTTGIGMEIIAGITSVVLGILALLHIHANVLLASDAIVLGLTLLYLCGVDARMNKFRFDNPQHKVLRESLAGIIDAQFIAGLGAVTLGILALVRIAPLTLIQVAFLTIGVILAIKGTTLAARLVQEYRETPAAATPGK